METEQWRRALIYARLSGIVLPSGCWSHEKYLHFKLLYTVSLLELDSKTVKSFHCLKAKALL